MYIILIGIVTPGATHDVYNRLFFQFKYSKKTYIVLSYFWWGSLSLPIISFDSISLITPHHFFHLYNVLCAPHISKKLLSILKFTKDNSCFFEIHPNFLLWRIFHMCQELLWGRLNPWLRVHPHHLTFLPPLLQLLSAISIPVVQYSLLFFMFCHHFPVQLITIIFISYVHQPT